MHCTGFHVYYTQWVHYNAGLYACINRHSPKQIHVYTSGYYPYIVYTIPKNFLEKAQAIEMTMLLTWLTLVLLTCIFVDSQGITLYFQLVKLHITIALLR